MRLKSKKRDLQFAKSLPAFDFALSNANPLAYATAPLRDLPKAAAEQWTYHLHDALDVTRYALLKAYTNQHPGFHQRIGRIFVKTCWFNLAVLSLQSSCDKLAHVARAALMITRWQGGKRPSVATEKNTSLQRVNEHLHAIGRQSPAAQLLSAFMAHPRTKAVHDLANQLKHGETLAWRGFAIVPVFEVEYPVAPLPAGKPSRAQQRHKDVAWMFSFQRSESLSDGRRVYARLAYGHRRPYDVDRSVEEIARVYRDLVPVSEAIVREVINRTGSS